MIDAPRARYAALLFGARLQVLSYDRDFFAQQFPGAHEGDVVRWDGRPFRVAAYDMMRETYQLEEIEEHPTDEIQE